MNIQLSVARLLSLTPPDGEPAPPPAAGTLSVERGRRHTIASAPEKLTAAGDASLLYPGRLRGLCGVGLYPDRLQGLYGAVGLYRDRLQGLCGAVGLYRD